MINYRDIYHWMVGSQDYGEGSMLYHRYGTNPNIKRMLLRPRTDYYHERLVYELKAILGDYVPDERIDEPETHDPPPNDSVVSIQEERLGNTLARASTDPSALPVELQAARLEQRTCYRTRDRLHAQLRFLDVDDRFMAQQEMLRCQRRIMEIWEALDYYAVHQVILPRFLKRSSPADRDRLIKRRNTLRSYLSRYKDQATEERKAKYKQYSDELAQVVIQLGEA